jgi:hypothetical protein
LTVPVTFTTAQTILQTELLAAGNYFVTAAATFAEAGTDCFVSLALAIAGGASISAGSTHLHTGETESIALPLRPVYLASSGRISLIATSVETSAVAQPAMMAPNMNATHTRA